MPFYLLMLSLLAGWLVNLAADTLPQRRRVGQTWFWPLCLAPALWPARLAIAADPGALHPKRSLAVWLVACVIGWLAYQCTGAWPQTFVLAAQAWFFLAIAVIDLEHRRVLNRMLVWALPFILLGQRITANPSLTYALLGAVIGFALFCVLALICPGGMGMGDAKLAALIGLTLGLPNLWIALWVGVLAGGVASLVILLGSRFRRRQSMAYAPYLVLGTWIALFWSSVQGQLFLEHLL